MQPRLLPGADKRTSRLERSVNNDTEHEEATFEVERSLRGQEATESVYESSSNLQHDTHCPTDSNRYDDLQVKPRDTPDIHPGDGGEESCDQTTYCEEDLEKAKNGALKPT
jgi:hypothetical protein